MKKLKSDTVLGIIVLILIYVAVFYISGIGERREDALQDKYDDGYDEGYEYGYSVGYDNGKYDWNDTGYDEGYYDGYENGYEDGTDEVNQDSYSAGYDEGYYAGGTYMCLYYGDVDKAFQCAKNGFSWDTFVTAYDTYIQDIYEDDDTAFEIWWTMGTADLGHSLTEHEYNLLIDTFGEELFTRNDITLTVE